MKTLLKITSLLLSGLALAACQREAEPAPGAPVAAQQQLENGRYLAQLGDCVACHTRPGGTPYAGGRAVVTPYGAIWSTNLTPDAATGLGDWSNADFWEAMHHGRSKTLGSLYPAFPFTNFTRLSRADSDAIFAYLKSLPAASSPTPAAQLRFPYNQRWLMALWRALFFSPGSYQADAARPESWNRGAYLVQGLGHCDACHSERNALGAVEAAGALRGGTMAGAGWYAPPLSGAAVEPELLRSGLSAHGVATGPMASVVYYSLQHLSPADAQAIAEYLGSLPKAAAPRDPDAGVIGTAATTKLVERGKAVYEKQCQDCHAADGSGRPPAYPALAGNPAVLGPAVNPLRVIANGGYAPGTAGNPRPYGMPAFVGDLSDEDIAAVLSYVRRSWGNAAEPVSPVEVERDKVLPPW
jgi:mono/diheme cytochrome c family protein